MIADAWAREQALDPSQSFIVQAPAGSGKTGLLVYRYLTLLARVEKPQNILAITFTRKARAEMRERIVELMLAAQAQEHSNNPFEQQGIDLAKAVLQRDDAFGWKLLAAPFQMQILTIDAFSARLAGSMPWLSRLGDRPRTTDKAESHFAVAVEQVFDELFNDDSLVKADLEIIMLQLDFNYDKARRLFASMLAKRDQWLRHMVSRDAATMLKEVTNSWAELIADQLRRVQEMWPSDLLSDTVRLGASGATRIDENSARAVTEIKPLAEINEGFTQLSLEQWRALAAFILTKSGTVRASRGININLGFPSDAPDKAECQELFAMLADDVDLSQALSEVRALPSPTFSLQHQRCLQALDTVLKALAVRLQLRFRAAGECDHSEVTQRANLALSELSNPTDLGLQMDGQLHHILVDEFQDTSNAQLNLLQSLTAGWQTTDMKTVFFVGDPMQSIYRFREADVGLFLQVADNTNTQVFPNLDINALTLSHNFRSSRNMVSWFNKTFVASFPSKDSVLTGAIRYASAQTDKVGDDTEAVDYYLAASRTQEAEFLLQSVQSALIDLPENAQIAVLVRTRPQLDYLLPVLDQNQIPYQAVDIQALHEQQAILDAVSLARALCREDDRIAWLALMRGPWCGLTLEEMQIFAQDKSSSIWRNTHDQQCLAQLNSDSLQRLQRFQAVMGRALEQFQRVDLGSLVRWSWQQLGGLHTLGSTQAEDMEQLFEVLNALQRGGDLPSHKDMMAALSAMRASAQNSQRAKVVVSTIHKSKGLQYHTVILPGLSNRPKSDDREILMWAEYPNADGKSNLLLAPLVFEQDSSASTSSSHYDYLRHLDRQRAYHEVMRLMYVACTRAEQKLVLIGSAERVQKQGEITEEIRPPVKSSLLASVWDALESKFSLIDDSLVANKDALEKLDQTLFRLKAGYQNKAGGDFVWETQMQRNTGTLRDDEMGAAIDYDWATQVATGVGILLHEFLQYSSATVLELELDDMLKRRWRAELAALRVPDNRIDYAVQRLLTAIQYIQEDDNAKFIFAQHRLAQNEYTLSTLESGMVQRYRLDRTFVDDNDVRWIIDYKTTVTQNDDVEAFVDEQIELRHRQQLEKYGELMSQIESRPIKLALYFPLLKQFRSWDFEPRLS